MKTPLTLFAASIASALAAQPVFVHPDAIPIFGAYPVETRNYGFVTGLVTEGTGIVWDLSAQGYSVVGGTTDSILDPLATPYHGDYPGADIAVRLVNQFGYYRVTEDSVLDLGYRPSPAGPSLVYSDPALIVKLPSSVGDMWLDTLVTGSTTSTLEVTILAEGTIILADATIPDAVLVQRRQVNPGFTSVSTTWFRRSNCLVPLGNVLPSNGVIVRAPQSISTGVQEAQDMTSILIGPNPVTDHVTVRRMDDGELGAVSLLDATGRVLQRAMVNASAWQFDLDALPDAVYIVRIGNGDARLVHRVVKAAR